MCMAPDPPKAPDPVQEVKQPESLAVKKDARKRAGMAGGSLLTSPSGIQSGALNMGAPSLLGG